MPTTTTMANLQTGNALVLFESRPARNRMLALCERLARPSPPGDAGVLDWYSFEDLEDPHKRTEAGNKAVEAEVLAFGVTCGGDFPDTLKLWTETWLNRRSEREGWLVGLIFEETVQVPRVAGLKEIYLRHLAHRAGMDYLSHVPEYFWRAIPNSLDSFSARAGQVTPVLDAILHQGFIPPPLRLK